MTPEIALLLVQDGISTGAIYVLVALGLVLIFLVTRVIFVPFGDVVGYAALTLAALQLKQLPGTVWLVLTIAALATAMEVATLVRRGQIQRLPRALLMYAVLPIVPVALVWFAAGRELPMWLSITLTLAIVLPISPLLYRIAFQPLADASVLVLLIVAVAVHFAISGMALIFFGPEGFRTQPMTQAFFDLGPVSISGQSLLIRCELGALQPAAVHHVRAHVDRQGVARHCRQPRGRETRRHPAIDHGRDRVLAGVDAGGDFRHPDRAGGDTLL